MTDDVRSPSAKPPETGPLAGRPPTVDQRHVVDAKTVEMLVCPLTKTRLTLSARGDELISVAAHLAFPIRDGVPMLSLDEAREFDPDDLEEKLPDLSGN